MSISIEYTAHALFRKFCSNEW